MRLLHVGWGRGEREPGQVSVRLGLQMLHNLYTYGHINILTHTVPYPYLYPVFGMVWYAMAEYHRVEC